MVISDSIIVPLERAVHCCIKQILDGLINVIKKCKAWLDMRPLR